MKSRRLIPIKIVPLSILALVLLSAWIFIVYKSHSLKEEVGAIEAEAKNKSSENSYLISVKNTLRDVKDELETIEARFIDKDHIPDFINILEGKVAEAGVKADFGAINVDAQSLSVRITGSGSWESVMTLISILDSLPSAATIDSVSLQKPESQDAQAPWNFVLSLTQYVTEAKQ